jgi:CPA1 family monovalent cation:H+ antiporter
MFLVSWASVRGSVTLATALAVPVFTATGAPLPERDLVVFLAASTIVLTLALNGVPLPWLIRRLRAPTDHTAEHEESVARVAIAHAAIAAMQPTLAALTDAHDRGFLEQLIHRYETKVALREGEPAVAALRAGHIAAARRLRLLAIEAERECLYRLRAQNTINDETVRLIEQELDEREMMSSADPLRG